MLLMIAAAALDASRLRIRDETLSASAFPASPVAVLSCARQPGGVPDWRAHDRTATGEAGKAEAESVSSRMRSREASSAAAAIMSNITRTLSGGLIWRGNDAQGWLATPDGEGNPELYYTVGPARGGK